MLGLNIHDIMLVLNIHILHTRRYNVRSAYSHFAQTMISC